VQVSKSSLVNFLLDQGEENIAALLAGSALPDRLDTERDAGTLAEHGLDAQGLRAMLPAVSRVVGPHVEPEDGHTSRMEQTISRRWADLVARWGTELGGGLTTSNNQRRAGAA
jgi:hypothetical protein